MSQKFDLENRLVNFSLQIIKIAELLPLSFVGKHISSQLVRSGTSPALHYGEAQGAESRTDFIHKMKICLKELRETFISLKIIKLKPLIMGNAELQDNALKECNELISIFVKSIETAKKNREQETGNKEPRSR